MVCVVDVDVDGIVLAVVAVFKDGVVDDSVDWLGVDDRIVVDEGLGQSMQLSLILPSLKKSSVEFPNSSTTSSVSRY